MAVHEKTPPLPHSLELQDRSHLTATGVTEVVRFDDTAVVLRTGQGLLTIRGEGLQLKNLSLEGGRMAVDGKIQGLVYEEPRTGGWLKGLCGGCGRRYWPNCGRSAWPWPWGRYWGSGMIFSVACGGGCRG